MADVDHDENLHSDHTISMRKAFSYCKALIERLDEFPTKVHDTATLKNAFDAARCISDTRRVGLERFCNAGGDTPTLDVVHVDDSMSVLEFRKEYLHKNIPCIVCGLDKTSHFAEIIKQWSESNPEEPSETKVNVKWFYERVGRNTLVPVRLQAQNTDSSLDMDGRAVECTVQHVELERYITEMLVPSRSDCYLKDWHLSSTVNLPYVVPPQFEGDLLNDFLTRFTSGDYKFVYWGPPGSLTDLHSDVLSSFSWSLNIIGEKEWTFYMPNTDKEFVIRQKAGQVMFVASDWKHKVCNVKETLSINHNWITASIVDCVWKCIQNEMMAVHEELEAWGNAADYEVQESMLHGCVGLNVTAFFFMILCGQIRLLTRQEPSWENYFDMFCLHFTLANIIENCGSLKERLSAGLESSSLANQTLLMAAQVVKLVEHVTLEMAE